MGDITATLAYPSFNGTPITTSQSTYDKYGRAVSATDADNNTTQTTYNPTSGVLPRQVATKNPAGWTSTTTLDRGHAVTETGIDANGRQTDSVYDGLGRVTATWSADRGKTLNPNSPNTRFSYGLFGAVPGSASASANPYVQTQTLREDGSYGQSFAILDGFGDVVETQATPLDGSGGLNSTQTEYNSFGKAWRTASGHWDAANAPSGTFRNYGDALPAQTVTTYDGVGRALTVAQYHNGVAVPGAVDTAAYPGVDRVDETAPAGNGTAAAGATSTVSDARGYTTATWVYHNNPPTPTGNAADADVTTYAFSYVANGATYTVTDPTTKNTWTTNVTDLLGHTVTKQDPDTGTSRTVVDNAGLLTQTQDARGQYLSYYYDGLGRRTSEYNAAWTSGTPDATKLLASWAYDTAPSSDGKTTRGLPASSTRYTDNGANAYVTAVTGYDAGARSLGTKMTIPAADGNGALAGTYQTNNSYTPVTGLLDHSDLPAAGGLPAETVYNSYNVNGLLLATGGNADYVVDTQYDQLGRILSRTLGDYPNQVVTQNLYDAATGRTTNTFVDASAGQNPSNPSQLNTYSVDDNSYTYDAAGQLTSAADLQNWTVSGTYNPGAAARDNQCYTYDYAGRLTAAWADKGDQTPSATTNLNSPTTATGALGSCADSTADNPPTAASALGGPAPYWQSYTYDATGAAGLGNGALTGNRSTVTDHDITGNTANDVTRTSAYPAAGTANTAGAALTTGTGPHLLKSVTATGGATGTDTDTYDGAGNTTGRTVTSQGSVGNANETLAWDAEGRLSTDANLTTNTTASFVYTADGDALIRRDYTTGTTTGSVTLYLGSTELHLATATGAVTGLRYYDYLSAPTIIADASGKLVYEIGNPQGTGETTLNAANGQVIARRYFKPFGEQRGTAPASWPDDHTFLGAPTDAQTGLTTVGARTYDAQTGRFVSVDPVFEAVDQNQRGGYAYSGDDPVSHSDPSGLTRADMCHDGGGIWQRGQCVYPPDNTDSSSACVQDPALPGCPGVAVDFGQTTVSAHGGRAVITNQPKPDAPEYCTPGKRASTCTPGIRTISIEGLHYILVNGKICSTTQCQAIADSAFDAIIGRASMCDGDMVCVQNVFDTAETPIATQIMMKESSKLKALGLPAPKCENGGKFGCSWQTEDVCDSSGSVSCYFKEMPGALRDHLFAVAKTGVGLGIAFVVPYKQLETCGKGGMNCLSGMAQLATNLIPTGKLVDFVNIHIVASLDGATKG